MGWKGWMIAAIASLCLLAKYIQAADAFDKERLNLYLKDSHYAPHRVIVKLKDNPKLMDDRLNLRVYAEKLAMKALGQDAVDRVKPLYPKMNSSSTRRTFVIEFKDMPANIVAHKLKALDDFEHVELDYGYYFALMPNDEHFSQQWNLHNTGKRIEDADIDAPEAWDIQTGDLNVIIAVVDTGLDRWHPEMVEKAWINEGEIPGDDIDNDGNGYKDDAYGWNFYENNNVTSDVDGHGTAVASVAAANTDNVIGIAGVAWNATVMPLRVSRGEFTFASMIAEAVYYAADNGAKIINLSVVSLSRSYALEDALDYAYDHGCLLVAAMGDLYYGIPLYPAALNHTLAVGATNNDDLRARASNTGYHIDLSAPGENVFVALPGNKYQRKTGSSLAAATVSGIAALVWSQFKQLSNKELMGILLASADDIEEYSWDVKTGWGRANALKALTLGYIPPTCRIITPHQHTYVDGKIDITGSACGEGFSSFKLEYGRGSEPSEWTAFRQSFTPVDHGMLGVLNLTGKPGGMYAIRLTVTGENKRTATHKVVIYVRELDVLTGWPFDAGASVLSSVAIADVNDDGRDDVVFGAMDGAVYVLDHNRAPLDGWPVMTNGPVLSSPAVGDIDDDGKLDIVVGSMDSGIYAWNHQGELLPGWPVKTGDMVLASPTLADLDGDRFLEVIIGSFDKKLYAFHYSGNVLDGWPFETLGEIFSTAAVGDVTNDGNNEVVVGINQPGSGDMRGRIYLFRNNGVLFPKYPLLPSEALPLFDYFANGVSMSPALADVDGDGELEIIVGAVTGSIHVYNYDTSQVAQTEILPAATNSSVALGEIDGAAGLEMVAGLIDYDIFSFTPSYMVGGWNIDATVLPRWHVPAPDLVLSSPIIADVTGDGRQEILIGCGDNSVIGLLRNGDPIPGFPKRCDGWIFSSPAVGDLDNDKRIELVVGSASGKVFAWKMSGQYSEERLEWRQFHHDNEHTGRYGDTFAPKPPKGLVVDAVQGGLSVSWLPNNEDDLAGYLLFYDYDESLAPYNGKGANIGDSPVDVGMNTYTVMRSLTIGLTYYIRVAAYDTSGNVSRYSNLATRTYTGDYEGPMILCAGWWDTYLDRYNGGLWKLFAYIVHWSSPSSIANVEIYYSGMPTGIRLFDDGASNDGLPGDGIFGGSFTVPGGLLPLLYPFEIMATDNLGNASLPWPKLTVPEY